MIKNQQEYQFEGYTYVTRKLGFEYPPELVEKYTKLGLELPQDWWCGYVFVPDNHPLKGIRYDEIWKNTTDDIECHGGLTYSEYGLPQEASPTWVIGFDCNHYDDNPIDKDEDYVRHECRNIIRQLIILGLKQ